MAISKLNHRHEAIFNWVVSNPHRTLGDAALAFGYSQSWLSQIIHSDMFQAKLREHAAKTGQDVYSSITSKMKACAALSADRMLQRLESGTASERFIIDANRTALQVLGYTSESAKNNIQEHRHIHLHASVDADELLKARARATQAANQVTPPMKM